MVGLKEKKEKEVKATVNRKELINMVSQAKVGAAVRGTLPIVQNVLIDANGKLKVSGFNLEQRVEITDKAQKTVKVLDRAKITEKGSVLVNPKMLLDTLKGLSGDKVQLSTKGNNLVVECGGAQTKFTVVPVDDYPVNPAFEEGYRFTAVDLAEALNKVVQAIATEGSRPVLNAACLTIKEGKCQLAAADGFRLNIADLKVKKLSISIVDTIKDDKPIPALQILVPLGAVRNILKLFANTPEVLVTVSKSKPKEPNFPAEIHQAVFEADGIQLKTMLIQGTYPNFSQLIPTAPEHSCKVSTSELLQAVKLVKGVARDASGIVRLEGGKGKLRIHAKSEVMGATESVIPCRGDIKIAANYRYLEEMLGVLDGESVTLQTSQPSSPILVKEPGLTWVAMPMFVSW